MNILIPYIKSEDSPPTTKMQVSIRSKRFQEVNYDASDWEYNFWSSSSKEHRRLAYKQKCYNRIAANNRRNKQKRAYKCDLSRVDEHEVLDPHFGLESISTASFTIDLLAKFAGINVPDRIVREVEGLGLLLVNLTQQTTTLGVTTSVLTWVQGRVSKSIFKTVKDFIENLFLTPQSSSIATPDWLMCLRDMRQNWQLCKSNRAFKQVSVLLGCLCTLGLCDVSDLTFNLGQFQLFAPKLTNEYMTAFDVADAIFETVVFFTEGAYLCFQTKSLKPLLINDRSAMELDVEYAQVMAWYDLVQNGNLKKFANVSDQEFEHRLNILSTNLLNLSHSLKGPEKKLVLDKFQKILIVQNDFVSMKIASGVRHSPWAIELFGDSAQGKTTMGDQIVDAVLTSQSMPVDKEYRCAYNPGDKFMSNWTSDKLVMIFDDVSNEKSTFVERPPTRAILDVINNQMYYAPKAELSAKGKCFVEPWIAMATTNKKDLDAGLYSNCPYSIQRRMIVLTVRAKPEFQKMEGDICCGIDSTKVREFYTVDGEYVPPIYDDIWTVTIETAVKPTNLKTVASYTPLWWRGKQMVDVSMGECIQWAIESFDNHRKNQEALLAGMRARSNNMKKCLHEGCIHIHGNCPDHPISDEALVCAPCTPENPLEPHFGRETVKSVWRLWYDSKARRDRVEEFWEDTDKRTAELLYRKGSKFLSDFDWAVVVPKEALEHKNFRRLFKFYKDDEIIDEARCRVRNNWVRAIFLPCACILIAPWQVCAIILCLTIHSTIESSKDIVSEVEEEMFQRLREKNMGVAPIVAQYRDSYAKTICYSAVGLAALYGLARAYRAFRKEDEHGSLEPKTVEEVKIRDAEYNPWTSMVVRELPISETSERMSADQLDQVVHKALVYGSIHVGDSAGMVNGLMLSSNVMLIPNHYFDEFGDLLNCTFRKRNPESSGGKFVARISKSATHLVPNTDLRVCYVPNGGSFKNLVNFFPTGDMPSVPFRLHYRQKDGEIITAKGVTKPQVVTTYRHFNGGLYNNLTMNTFQGLCGATLVSDTNGSCILGVHLGGTAGTPRGCYGSLTQQQLSIAFDELRKMEGVVLTGEAGKFRTEVLGVQFLRTDDLHPKSPLNYLPPESQIQYHGSCIGRGVATTNVEKTPISPIIEEVCQVPNIYRGPVLHPEWKGWQECLANMANPAIPYPHELLAKAVVDYKRSLIPIFKSELWCKARPLTDHENLCGIPGVKFMDAIKLDTSVGFPLSGPKRDFVTELPPEEGKPNNRILDDIILKEIAHLEDCYRRGERGYPIAKACKKDEILSKPKCRIFYGNSISLTYLIRKYYLPVLRILQMNPIASECCVGINCHGPEWEALHKRITTFGTDRILAGDYGKYDQKLCVQLILASLRILIDFAGLCSYTEEDKRIMSAMCGDIVFAYVAFNGDLISLTEGSHISGNSLTVIINSICGSLNMRCFYFATYPDTQTPFNEVCALAVYGDDNSGSVAEGYPEFNIKNVSKFLESYGQTYTMPDKESELVEYLPWEDFEFLKRTSVYHPKLGVHIGALVDKSIYKSLHCFIREKNCVNTREHACAINIDGALREWFNHGEEKYEKQRALMQEVAKKAEISHMCTMLNVTYNQRAAEWVEQYCP